MLESRVATHRNKRVWRNKRCTGCREPFGAGDRFTVDKYRRFWHIICWLRHEEDQD